MKRLGYFVIIAIVALATSAYDPVEKGDKVPEFSALDENGDTWKLSDQRADYLVVYFYPAAFTGGCTKQACSYRDHDTEFKLLNASIVGISGDDHQNLGKFKEHHNLNFTLLSDTDGKIAGIFGVPVRDGDSIEKEVGGQTLQLNRGVTTSRWTFVIDVNGKLIYRDSEVSASTDPEKVLKFIGTHDQRKSCVPRR
jgi:peroxiredoxin Q/BCP